ncbi:MULTISPECIES: Crp/Fnr family transcriptional regulator [Bradyrhizobium]|uniref:Crp/Fnr family transcriptional regulator n=1 Tax=Bradyrhizobium TaxID=374 RepID=UPI001BA87510|nr:Crp/Fnr family transcriptional regulator [Bradyrhizobium sp. NDS-1]MBR0813297.1 Crp/Fnr family transcriptional regulator [Bradyrhizobium diazoefficiens]WOH70953.1 Crp/Fnr family transcriptional regulator [Bradyrhizobium sp. NDS-1]
MTGRPLNDLLRQLAPRDFELLAPHLQLVELEASHILHHAGDAVAAVHFPCGPTLVSFAVPVEDDREVESLLVGREGAVGVAAGRNPSLAYSRIVVKLGGALVRLPLRALEQAQQRSAALQEVFSRYADCQFAQLLQTAACNAAHSIEQRAAKWIISTQEHIGQAEIPLTHEQLAGMLGVSRSYASRVIQMFKARRILATRRGAILVLDAAALDAKACCCNDLVKKHFDEVLGRATAAQG